MSRHISSWISLHHSAAAIAALLAAALHIPCSAQGNAEGAAAAARDLYLKISSRDMSVLQYIPPTGFSEINSGGNRHQLDARAFEKLFAGPLKIDLHAEGLRSMSVGGAVLVTGTRVGSLTPPGQTPKEERYAFSMFWVLSGEQWQLEHVHLSGPLASPS